jgi:DNA-binding winged helix-turn-helix (wHTH) protein
MPDLAKPVVYRFDDFLLDRRARTLFRLHPDGHTTAVQIGSRGFQILSLLVDHRGAVISRREIMDTVWPNVAVEQNNLTVQLSALRRVLDADRGQDRCIQNIAGRGYRFVPKVTEADPPSISAVECPTEDQGFPTLSQLAEPPSIATADGWAALSASASCIMSIDPVHM